MQRLTRSSTALGILAIGTAVFLLAVTAIGAQPSGTPAEQPQGGRRGAPDIGKLLVDGLNQSAGCLKVITARTSQGTTTIIGWFENKAAVEKWYYSQTHARVMRMVGSDPDVKEPMAHVADGDAPVMVMASITLGGKGVLPGPMPVSQISIELYRPLDAGASVNGRLMPDEIRLEHFNTMNLEADDS